MRVAIACLALTGVLFYFFPELTLPLRFPRIRSPYCTVTKAMADAKIMVRQNRLESTIARRSRLIRREQGLDLWQTPDGEFWMPPGNAELLPTLLAQQARNIYGEQRWGVGLGDIVLDCGAHIGVYTRKALADGARLVVAVEPAPENVACLRRNLASEIASGKVIVVAKGVWDRQGALTLFANEPGGAGSSFVVEEEGTPRLKAIPVTTIDRLVEDLKLPKVDFIKADIKGATERAVAGASSVLSEYHPRLAISTEEPPENPKSITELIQRLAPGYEMKCGPCVLANNYISTDVVFFRWAVSESTESRAESPGQ
jgi:FkbM family methyltransferase